MDCDMQDHEFEADLRMAAADLWDAASVMIAQPVQKGMLTAGVSLEADMVRGGSHEAFPGSRPKRQNPLSH